MPARTGLSGSPGASLLRLLCSIGNIGRIGSGPTSDPVSVRCNVLGMHIRYLEENGESEVVPRAVPARVASVGLLRKGTRSMAHDEPRHQDDEPSRSDEPRHDACGPITIATTDPVIESVVEHRSDWKAHPDTTVRVETTQVSEPSPLYVSGVRSVVVEEEPRQGRRRSDEATRSGDPGHNRGRRRRDQDGPDKDRRRDDRQDQPRDRQQPSMTKNLLITAGVALVCGVIGAIGYSYVFGSKSDESGQSQDRNEQARSKQASSAKKSGGGGSSKDSGKESNAQASTSSSIPGFSSAEDADTLKKQIMDLMQRVDRLGERVDRMSRPKDETPPVLRTMQIKMGELAREMDEVASLPAQVRHLDNRIETLQEEFKTLRARIEAMQGGSIGGRMSPGMTLPPANAAAGRLDDPGPDNPTLDLGIHLLERGQYASAREVFLRLQVAQPDDARVWYFSALAEGLTSGDWDGEAKRLVEKGLECERAGHPSTARIDAALATRTPIKGEDWIASLRRRVLNAGNGEAK